MEASQLEVRATEHVGVAVPVRSAQRAGVARTVDQGNTALS